MGKRKIREEVSHRYDACPLVEGGLCGEEGCPFYDTYEVLGAEMESDDKLLVLLDPVVHHRCRLAELVRRQIRELKDRKLRHLRREEDRKR